MDFITLDFETFYGDGYTLSTLTTEEYVRDPRFEVILCSFKVNDNPSFWVPQHLVPQWIEKLELHKHAVVMHHAHFDDLILSHHFSVRPKLIIDTLGMARAVHGANGKLALAKLAERYGLESKGTEVHNVRNMRFKDFTPEGLKRYGEYGCTDCDIEWELAKRLLPHFSKTELQINDRVIRMFTEPKLELDSALLREYADELRSEKVRLLLQAGVQLSDVSSNEKFAQALLELGIEPPMKISPTTGKLTYAFAKTDPAMQALQDHPDEIVQILIEARLKNKSTLAEKRAERMISMQSRGPTCIYLKYSGASGTHRLSGGDKMNWQNLTRGSKLRMAVRATLGQVVVVGDSSNIEARMLDWLAGQEDMVEVYRRYDADPKNNPDMYCIIAGRIYKRLITKADVDERQLGKIAKLGLGFGLGSKQFVIAVRRTAKNQEGKPLILTQDFGDEVVEIYRDAHQQVKKLWKRCEGALKAIFGGQVGVDVDYQGVVKTCEDGLLLPNGMKILYPDLQYEKNQGTFGGEWSFWNGKLREKIYGAKVCENIIQALARIVVMEQSLTTAKQLDGIASWVHSVHDEAVLVTDIFYAPYVRDTLLNNMREPLSWCRNLPLNSEGGYHQQYGKAKK